MCCLPAGNSQEPGEIPGPWRSSQDPGDNSQSNTHSALDQVVAAVLHPKWQKRPSARQSLQMLTSPQEEDITSTHNTVPSHQSAMGKPTPPSSSIRVPETAPLPSISLTCKTAASGSASAVPVKNYGSLQEAQQELQAVVAAMQALLADANSDSRLRLQTKTPDSELAAARSASGPSGPYGEPPQVRLTS